MRIPIPIRATVPIGTAIATAVMALLRPPVLLCMLCSLSSWRAAEGDDVDISAFVTSEELKVDEMSVVGRTMSVPEAEVGEVVSPMTEEGSWAVVVAGGGAVVLVEDIKDETESSREVVVEAVGTVSLEVDDGEASEIVGLTVALEVVVRVPEVVNVIALSVVDVEDVVLPPPSRLPTPSPSAPRSPPSLFPSILANNCSPGASVQKRKIKFDRERRQASCPRRSLEGMKMKESLAGCRHPGTITSDGENEQLKSKTRSVPCF